MAKALTKEDQIIFEDLQKNLPDKLWRLSNLYKIKDKDGQIVTFKPNPAQTFMLQHIWYWTLVLKSRQLGSTTFWVILLLDMCLFGQTHFSAGIIAQTENDAHAIIADKVRFAFDNLPSYIKAAYLPLLTDRKDKIEFQTKSSIFADRSMRSGTYQALLITEFGKICSEFPDHAEEIVSGAFPTIATGNYLIVESTAEGWEGRFYEYCQQAMKLALEKKKLSQKEFRFLFLAWYLDPRNILPETDTIITKEDHAYFDMVEVEVCKLMEHGHIMPIPGGKLTPEQKAWYVTTKSILRDKMNQENPSYPEESFSNTAKAAYWCEEMVHIRKENHIRTVAYERGYPVNTSWDFGKRGYMTIWFHQYIHGEHRLIHYYENFGKDFSHYVGYMQRLGYNVWGCHFLPHDARTQRLLKEGDATYETMLNDLGLKETIVVPRTASKKIARATAADFLMGACFFDRENCSVGIERLEKYKRIWVPRAKAWRDSEEEGHGADSFMALACGWDMRRDLSGKAAEFLKNRKKPSGLAFR